MIQKRKESKESKEKRFKSSFKNPSFINSDGVVITTSLGVKVPNNRNGEPMIEQALREFKRIVKDAKILDEYKDRQEYIKPSLKRRKMMQLAIRAEQLNSLDFYQSDIE